MNRREFSAVLRSAGAIGRERDFIVFGSQAILGLVVRPPKACLASMELDIYPRHNLQAVQLLVAKLGNRSDFSRRNGYYVDCVSPEIATLPAGWAGRLVPFSSKGTGGVTGWCLEMHDLVVSKLAAGRAKDLKYIGALLDRKLARPDILKRRIAGTPIAVEDKEALLACLRKLLEPKSATGRKIRK